MAENTRNIESEKKYFAQTKENANIVYTEIISRFRDSGIELDNRKNNKKIEGKYSQEPNRMFAIYGGWGTGKTTLLEEIEALAKDKFIEDRFEIVWFRPWEYYDEAKDIDKKLLFEIINKTRSQIVKIISQISFFVRKFFIVFILIFIPLLFINNQFNIHTIVSQFLFKQPWFIIINIPYLVLLLIIVLLLSFLLNEKNLKYISSLGVGWINFNLQEVTTIFNQFKNYTLSSDNIRNIIDKKVGKNKQILIFIDDLDRCQKETVIEVLEHVKHFYNVKQLYFVFALDRKTLASYISEHYQYQDEKGIFDINRGYQYLDKLFPYSYNLRYLDTRYILREYLEKYGIIDYLTEENIELYYQFIEYYANFNLRKVSSLIYRFAQIYKKIKYSKVVQYYDNDTLFLYLDQIFRWCLVHEFYPEIFQEIGWRKAIINKFYENGDENGCNLFREQAFVGGEQNRYITAISDVNNTTFHLEKLYNYGGKMNIEEKSVQYQYEGLMNGKGGSNVLVNIQDIELFKKTLTGDDNSDILRDEGKVLGLLKTCIDMDPTEKDDTSQKPGLNKVSGKGKVNICKYSVE